MSKKLTFKETAGHLRISKGQLSKIINGKVTDVPKLPVVRMGRNIIVIEETLEQWCREREA